MNIAIFGRTFSPSFQSHVVSLFDQLQKHQCQLFIYAPFHSFLLGQGIKSLDCGTFSTFTDAPDDIDVMISMGGDGTLLESIQYLKSFDIPVIGFNTGRLGFLADISKEDISQALEAVFAKNYTIEPRSLLSMNAENELFDGLNFALNEATIQKNDSSLLTIEAYVNDAYVNTYWTDGLIVSTPTGSTAYSLSVGGPIVVPGSHNFIIAPIASHNLTVRPIIVPDTVEVKLVVKPRSNNFLATVDNRTEIIDARFNTFILKKAAFELKMLRLKDHNYYHTIRSKLMWGADKRN